MTGAPAVTAVYPAVPQALLHEIDAAHARTRDAFRRCDTAAYSAFLAPDFTWHDPDGRTRTAEEIGRDVQVQFARLVGFDTRFRRDESSLEGLCVTESGTQVARIDLRVFLVFAVRWNIERRGTYTWKRGPDGWRLLAVRLTSEQTRFGGLRFVGVR
ncbi:MAG: nuclear transport factor 2 family protein [Gemmatimonadaceae bacterium]|nr:nuclear transport factor 2 family protein [Gemmatimonadaceae bacterium]